MGMVNSGDCRRTLSAMSHGDLPPLSLSVCRSPKQRSRTTSAFCRPIPPPAAPIRLVFPGVGDVDVTPPPPLIGDTAAPQEWVITFPPPPPTAPQSTILVTPLRPDEAGPPPTLPPGRGPAHEDSQGAAPVRLVFPGVGEVDVTPPPPRIGDTAAPQEWVIRFPPPPPIAPRSTILVPPPRPDEAGPPPTLPPGRGPAHEDSQGLPDAALKFIIEVFIPDKRTAEIVVPTAHCSSENRPDTVGNSENDMPESWTLAALASDPIGELAKLVQAVDSRIEIKIIVGSIILVLSGLAQFSVPGGELALTKILEAVLLEMNPKIGKGVLTLCASCAIGFLRTKNAAGAKPKDHA